MDYRKNGNIIRIQVLSNSSAIWTISPPSRDFLVRDLQSNNSISMQFKYEFNRSILILNALLKKFIQICAL